MVNLTKATKSVSEKTIKREWHLVDAKGAVLGRFATDVAKYLIGKHKRNFVSYMDQGDYVIVINAAQIVITGRKEDDKTYTRYSGYPGGLKKISFAEMKEKNPQGIVKKAIWGMLPKNKLRDRRIARLHIYKDEKHPYENKLKNG
jgi:large subunit ribosomal protein L13